MKNVTLPAVLCMVLGLSTGAAYGSDIARFNLSVADAYRHYRQAIFYIRTENPAVAALELDEFVTKWTAAVDRFASAPPDSYADDPAWAGTLQDIRDRAEKGLAALDDGDLAGAREVLEPVRRVLADLRKRNGIAAFSDQIDELTAAMDILARYRREVTDLGDDALVEPVRRQAAVVEYLFEEVRRNAPAEIAADPEFKRMYEGVAESMGRLWRGLATRDPRLFRIGSGELRSHERMLYLRFG